MQDSMDKAITKAERLVSLMEKAKTLADGLASGETGSKIDFRVPDGHGNNVAYENYKRMKLALQSMGINYDIDQD